MGWANRFLGFEQIFSSSCENDIRVIVINNTLEIDSYLNPIALLVCYYTLSLTSVLVLSPKVSFLNLIKFKKKFILFFV